MSMSKQQDSGAYIKPTGSFAGSTVDSEVNTGWVDRRGFLSAELGLSIQGVLADGETVTFSGNWQDASDSAGSDAADFGDAVAAVVIQTGTTLTDAPGGLALASSLKANLTMAKRYIRAQYTLATSSSGTATHAATIILGGSDQNPV